MNVTEVLWIARSEINIFYMYIRIAFVMSFIYICYDHCYRFSRHRSTNKPNDTIKMPVVYLTPYPRVGGSYREFLSLVNSFLYRIAQSSSNPSTLEVFVLIFLLNLTHHFYRWWFMVESPLNKNPLLQEQKCKIRNRQISQLNIIQFQNWEPLQEPTCENDSKHEKMFTKCFYSIFKCCPYS